MSFGRQGDPVRRSAEGIDTAGFDVHRELAGLTDGLGQGIEVVVQRFAAGDHHKSGTGLLCLRSLGGQVFDPLQGMGISRPGVLGVAPAAAHCAARQSDEEGTAAGMEPFPLEGMEGFHNRQLLAQGLVLVVACSL